VCQQEQQQKSVHENTRSIVRINHKECIKSRDMLPLTKELVKPSVTMPTKPKATARCNKDRGESVFNSTEELLFQN